MAYQHNRRSFGENSHTPVNEPETWLHVAAISRDRIYRPIGKGGHIASLRLSDNAICHILRQRLAEAGMEPSCYSGQSLRSGFATSAAIAVCRHVKFASNRATPVMRC
jgi:hypothetical protein